MKLLKLSFLLVLITFLSACSDDDDPVCLQSDWVGTYTGTINCAGTTEDVEVVITAAGPDAVIINYDSDTMGSVYDPIIPNGCDIDLTDSDGTFTLIVDAFLDGDNLILREDLGTTTATLTCNITATRN